MKPPRVVLIGGSPSSGKSAVARRIAARYGYGCLSTDDIGRAIASVTTSSTHPELHTSDGVDYRDYFATTPVDILIDDVRRSHGRVWPALETIIQSHATWDTPLVLEATRSGRRG